MAGAVRKKPALSHPIATAQPGGWTRRLFGGTALASLAGTALATMLPGGELARAYARPVPAHPVPARPMMPSMPRPWHLASSAWRPGTSTAVGPTDQQKRAWFRTLVRCGARTMYVAGTGSDGNPGTAARPFREISRAVASARPGDLIVVDDGTYGYTEVRGFRGSASAWLGIMTRDASTRAVISVPPPTDNFVNIIDSHFVGVFGFEVVGDQHDPNTNGSGISVYGNSHHVAIWNNLVHDFPGGGINCFDVDGSHELLDISYNVVHSTSRYSPNNTSGISVYASRDLTAGATLAGGYGYRIVGNYVYNAVCTVPFTPGGYDFVTDGNGVSLDCIETTYGYRKPILVAGNVITGCGGRGVLAFNTVNVDIVGNTAAGNLRSNSPGIDGGAELESKTDRTVRILRNVVLPTNTPTTADAHGLYSGNVFLGGTTRVPAGNVDHRRLGLTYFAGKPTSAQLRTGCDPRLFAAARGMTVPT